MMKIKYYFERNKPKLFKTKDEFIRLILNEN